MQTGREPAGTDGGSVWDRWGPVETGMESAGTGRDLWRIGGGLVGGRWTPVGTRRGPAGTDGGSVWDRWGPVETGMEPAGTGRAQQGPVEDRWGTGGGQWKLVGNRRGPAGTDGGSV
jgi:hypothetical protein